MVTSKSKPPLAKAIPEPTQECFTVLTGLHRSPPLSEPDDNAPHQSHYCSFCDKGTLEVETMVVSPAANICGDCVELCRDIVGAHRVKLRCGDEAIIYQGKA